MPKPRNRLVTYMGAVYSMNSHEFKRMLTRIASKDDNWVMDDFGKYVGTIRANVTDMTPEEAKNLLGIQTGE